jgi:hypothetical protein
MQASLPWEQVASALGDVLEGRSAAVLAVGTCICQSSGYPVEVHGHAPLSTAGVRVDKSARARLRRVSVRSCAWGS